MDKLKSNVDKLGSATPTVFADDSSIVNAREITNTRAKSISMKIETVSQPGSRASGNVVGQFPKADLIALGNSVICTDKITNVNIDGDIDLSVSVKPANACAGPVDKRQPSSQGPAGKMITRHKVKIIDCLRRDHSYILQLVHQKEIVDERQYDKLKHISQPEQTIIDLIDQVIGKGEEYCSQFLEVLKEPDVLITYPQLKEITKNW
ncbi:uncharacterized protein [Thunnus thynnus]|uniref:uncharacterized protein isoform X3 n=1 Tax=Thunnus thynnus TaxID=8237 RepID=UPI003529C4F2